MQKACSSHDNRSGAANLGRCALTNEDAGGAAANVPAHTSGKRATASQRQGIKYAASVSAQAAPQTFRAFAKIGNSDALSVSNMLANKSAELESAPSFEPQKMSASMLTQPSRIAASSSKFAQFARSKGTGSLLFSASRFVVRLRVVSAAADTTSAPAATIIVFDRRRRGRASRRGSSSSINGFVASSPSEASWCSMAASCLFTTMRSAARAAPGRSVAARL
mmetsp:Transcript_23610/g.61628  ORF Transcript_23610/g.61628 Transcript_23610/m.61628 type:complete len:222 (+) Transcript_23610:276-941(+)